MPILQSQSALTRLANDPVNRLMAGYPHWESVQSPSSQHRAWEWTDPNGIVHRVGCGSGQHRSENAIHEDARQLQPRIRACEASSCDHVRTQEPLVEQLQPEVQEQTSQPQFKHGDTILYQNRPHIVTEIEDGLFGLHDAETGQPVTAEQHELGLSPEPPKQAYISTSPWSQGEIDDLREAARRAWGEDTRHEAFWGHPNKALGQCYVTAKWLKERLGGHVGQKGGHYFWVSHNFEQVLDFADSADQSSTLIEATFNPLYQGYELTPEWENERVARFIKRANQELEALDLPISKIALDYAGDAFPAEEPQAMQNMEDRYWHDEPEFGGGENEYKFVFANGQLEISPHHGFEELAEHAGVSLDSNAPMATGYALVNMGSVIWSVTSNIGAKALSNSLKNYSERIGWQWGGMTDLEGEPVGTGSEFAPKKKSKKIIPFRFIGGELLIGTEMTRDRDLLIRSSHAQKSDLNFRHLAEKSFFGTVLVTPHCGDIGTIYKGDDLKLSTEEGRQSLEEGIYALQEWAKDEGITLISGNDNVLKTIEDLELENIYSPQQNQKERGFFPSPENEQHVREPSGVYRCPYCDQIFPTYYLYEQHMLKEEPMGDQEPRQDGKFPDTDMDATHPPHFTPQQLQVQGSFAFIASAEDASRVDKFLPKEGNLNFVVAQSGCPVAAASVNSKNQKIEKFVSHRQAATAHLVVKLQKYFSELWGDDMNLAKCGFIEAEEGIYKWAQGQEPKDLLEASIPFIFDVKNDHIVMGHPGQRTSDVPGSFTPGGIVEGQYEPGGKVVLRSMTNMPYSTNHLLQLWYASNASLEIKSVFLQDDEGKATKLAHE